MAENPLAIVEPLLIPWRLALQETDSVDLERDAAVEDSSLAISCR
jgi:hypothetical protein